MIPPEALEKARATAAHEKSLGITNIWTTLVGPLLDEITALQAERDAAAPKLPDDLAGLVERLEEPGAVCWSDVTDARTTIQSLAARNAELEAGLKDTAEALRSRLTADELNAPHHKPYEHPLSAYDRAARLLNKDRQP